MKKGLKLIPFALAALMLVSCGGKTMGPTNGKDPIIGENGLTYQEFYDNLYNKHNGSEQAAKDLILAVAKDVVSSSEFFKDYEGENNTKGAQALVNDRKNEVLDNFYSSNYKKDSLFDEKKLVEDLTNKGYKITPKEDNKDQSYYEETFDEKEQNLLGYEKLHNKLKWDYSDYLSRNKEYDIYVQLLKEEYILREKTSYFSDKRIRKVQFFKYTPASSSQAETIKAKLEEALKDKNTISEKEFKELATTTFQKALNDAGLDKEAKDFAMINDKPSTELELKYKDEYKDLLIDGQINKDLTEKQIEELTSKMNTYTGNGAHSKFDGYLLKQIDVFNTLGYKESFLSSDDSSATLVDADIDTLIKKSTLKDHLIGETNLLDYTGSGSKVFKKDSSYFVVRVEEITSDTKGLDKLKGARALTNNSTNVKNAVSFFLEEKKVNVYEETLFNYLKDTFGFTK